MLPKTAFSVSLKQCQFQSKKWVSLWFLNGVSLTLVISLSILITSPLPDFNFQPSGTSCLKKSFDKYFYIFCEDFDGRLLTKLSAEWKSTTTLKYLRKIYLENTPSALDRDINNFKISSNNSDILKWIRLTSLEKYFSMSSYASL